MLPKLVTRPSEFRPSSLHVSSSGVDSYLGGLWKYVILGAISTTMLGMMISVASPRGVR